MSAVLCLVLLRGWKIGELDELARTNQGTGGGSRMDKNEQEMIAQNARKVGRRRILFDFAKWRKV